jgi:fucose 4-O-acetylase-like acetyltransferase
LAHLILSEKNMASFHPRNLFLDYAKGILILLVVFGHAIQAVIYHDFGMFGNQVFKAIYLFHMPLFMALAGYVSQASIAARPLGEFAGRRFVNLVLPIFCWSSLVYVVMLAAHAAHRLQDVPVLFWTNFFVSLWFLWALFECSIVAAVAKKFRCDNWWFALISTAIIYWIVPETGRLYLSKFTYPFFWLGYLMAKDREVFSRLSASRPVLLVAVVGTVAAYYFWDDATFVYSTRMVFTSGTAGTILFRLAAGVLASAVALWLMHRLFLRWPSSALVWLGTRSLYVFILQNYFFIAVQKHFGEGTVSPPNGLLLTGIVALPLAIAVALVCAWAGSFAERIPLVSLFFFGRLPTKPA